jgi:DNA-binding transcriptional ArsR family regulator
VDVDVALDAFGDSTRRQIVGRLARGAASVGELAETLPVGRPAVSMHLRVLREAGLVSARAEGTRRLYQLEPDALASVRDYLDWYWTQALEAFKQHVEAEGETEMEQEVKVSKSILVDAPALRAFDLFLDQARWWPLATHHIAEQPAETVVLEPFVGGRWYERSRDGNETQWGSVLAFEPPHRLLLSWQMSSDWTHEQDSARASEIEVSFLAEARNRTRVVFEHRHLERYGKQAERMRAALERPKAAEAVLRAFADRVATAKTARRRKAA